MENSISNSTPPQWTEQIYNEESGEDFLGLRSVSTAITTYLLPGIITITPRARYYSFYCWLLHEYHDRHPVGCSLGEFFKRREQIFVLANLIFDAEGSYGDGTTGMIGSRKLTQHILDYTAETLIPLNADDYLKRSTGGYSQYVGVMRNLGLIDDSDEPGIDLQLNPSSKKLSKGYGGAISQTTYYKNRHSFDVAENIPKTVLLEYGRACYLSGLANGKDVDSVTESLFAFDAKSILANPSQEVETKGNMASSLGLMLDMMDKVDQPFSDELFRELIMYGNCTDYDAYSPQPKLEKSLAHWQMFQIREYYIYALYELWIYFLDYLRTNGPFSYEVFSKHLSTISITETIKIYLSFTPLTNSFSGESIIEFLESILSHSDITTGSFENRCEQYASQGDVCANEKAIYLLLRKPPEGFQKEDRLVLATYLLFSLYLRLKAIKDNDIYNTWHWAKEGGTRRRSLAIFTRQMDQQIQGRESCLDTLNWIFQDYIIAQHTITALEKWQQRNSNTFHFRFENGIFEWTRMDSNGFSASRFDQAYAMIRDLGLVHQDVDGIPSLSKFGKDTLARVLEKMNE